MSARLGALASRFVGRQVTLKPAARTGTITRVTATGLVVKLDGILAEDIDEWGPDT